MVDNPNKLWQDLGNQFARPTELEPIERTYKDATDKKSREFDFGERSRNWLEKMADRGDWNFLILYSRAMIEEPLADSSAIRSLTDLLWRKASSRGEFDSVVALLEVRLKITAIESGDYKFHVEQIQRYKKLIDYLVALVPGSDGIDPTLELRYIASIVHGDASEIAKMMTTPEADHPNLSKLYEGVMRCLTNMKLGQLYSLNDVRLISELPEYFVRYLLKVCLDNDLIQSSSDRE